MQKIQIPKGTKDVLPDQVYLWHHVEQIIRDTTRHFGFSEIRFPAFEHTELFLRGVGDTTDIVQKEMYTFLDKGGRSITLRPEGTASVVRSVVENGLYAGTLPLKVYYIAPVFRYERPQAGRLREHHQFGVECFGSASPEADAEVIALADTFLRRLGIDGLTVSINSIGCSACRPMYHAALKEYFAPQIDDMCRNCKERLEKNPLRLLDCKEDHCHAIAKDAPKTIDYLCDECAEHFDYLQCCLDAMGIAYKVDSRIVRGLDYYTKTVFEFVASNIGAQATVCGGGRYDKLVETLGGPATPGLGFGIGIERLLMVLEASGKTVEAPPGPSIFIGSIGDRAGLAAQVLVCRLRQLGISAQRDLLGRSLKAQMKYADKLKAKNTIIIGDNEMDEKSAMMKNMQTGEQVPVSLCPDELAEIVLKMESAH
jgi:histidyl-tRNA synthetase